MDELTFHGTEGAEVVLSLAGLFQEIGFELRIFLPRNEGGIEKDMAQMSIASL